MTLSDLASIATVISSVAVLASLIYLAQQTRQNTRHTRAGKCARPWSDRNSAALPDEKIGEAASYPARDAGVQWLALVAREREQPGGARGAAP